MTAKPTHAGGLWCSEVLEVLSEFVDQELAPKERNAVEDHLASCNWCAQFGAEFSTMMSSLRATLAEPEPVSPELAARVARILSKEK